MFRLPSFKNLIGLPLAQDAHVWHYKNISVNISFYRLVGKSVPDGMMSNLSQSR